MLFDFFSKTDINKGVEQFLSTRNAVLLDVRTLQEYREGHIPHSINIEAGSIASVRTILNDLSTPIFVYCYS